MRSAARSTSPAASACAIASAGSPCASHQALARAVQLGDVVGMLVEQPGPEQVGEQVVVAVPAPPVVERDEEQVGALERLEHRGPAGRRR